MSECHSNLIEIPTVSENEDYLPVYSTVGAAGADVRAFLKEPLIIAPGQHAAISTGLRMAIPEGYEIQIRPRSGLAFKNLMTVLNTPGTIDEDYRGEIMVILINHGKEDFIVLPGMRIAQFVLAPVIRARFIICNELHETMRGAGGIGHTGTH